MSYTVGFRQSKPALFDWRFFRLDSSCPSFYRQPSRIYSFCALARGGWCEGILLYGSRSQLAALCFSLSPREKRLDETSSQRVGGVGLSRKPPKLGGWSYTQPKASKATAGGAVVGSMGSIPCAAAVV